MNPSLLAIAAGLTALMLAIFVATGQQLDLTITAVAVTGGISLAAAYFYGREEARAADEDYLSEAEETAYDVTAPEGEEEAPELVVPAPVEDPPPGHAQ